MYSSLILISIVLQSFFVVVRGDVEIVKPGRGGMTYVYKDDPRYRQGSTVPFQWTSGIKNIQVRLWQEWPVVKKGTNYYKLLVGE